MKTIDWTKTAETSARWLSELPELTRLQIMERRQVITRVGFPRMGIFPVMLGNSPRGLKTLDGHCLKTLDGHWQTHDRHSVEKEYGQ